MCLVYIGTARSNLPGSRQKHDIVSHRRFDETYQKRIKSTVEEDNSIFNKRSHTVIHIYPTTENIEGLKRKCDFIEGVTGKILTGSGFLDVTHCYPLITNGLVYAIFIAIGSFIIISIVVYMCIVPKMENSMESIMNSKKQIEFIANEIRKEPLETLSFQFLLDGYAQFLQAYQLLMLKKTKGVTFEHFLSRHLLLICNRLAGLEILSFEMELPVKSFFTLLMLVDRDVAYRFIERYLNEVMTRSQEQLVLHQQQLSLSQAIQGISNQVTANLTNRFAPSMRMMSQIVPAVLQTKNVIYSIESKTTNIDNKISKFMDQNEYDKRTARIKKYCHILLLFVFIPLLLKELSDICNWNTLFHVGYDLITSWLKYGYKHMPSILSKKMLMVILVVLVLLPISNVLFAKFLELISSYISYLLAAGTIVIQVCCRSYYLLLSILYLFLYCTVYFGARRQQRYYISIAIMIKKNENIHNYNFTFRCKFSILVITYFIVGGGFCVGVMMGIDSRKKKEADEALERIINEKVEEKRQMTANNVNSKSD